MANPNQTVRAFRNRKWSTMFEQTVRSVGESNRLEEACRVSQAFDVVRVSRTRVGNWATTPRHLMFLFTVRGYLKNAGQR